MERVSRRASGRASRIANRRARRRARARTRARKRKGDRNRDRQRLTEREVDRLRKMINCTFHCACIICFHRHLRVRDSVFHAVRFLLHFLLRCHHRFRPRIASILSPCRLHRSKCGPSLFDSSTRVQSSKKMDHQHRRFGLHFRHWNQVSREDFNMLIIVSPSIVALPALPASESSEYFICESLCCPPLLHCLLLDLSLAPSGESVSLCRY